MEKHVKLIAGNSNPALAKAVAKRLHARLANANISRFSDSEIQVQILESMRGSKAFVIQSTSHPANDNLMELLLILDALKRASASERIAVMPYYGYARQDRKALARDPISAKLVADLLQTAGADRVISMELHSGQIQGFFDVPVDNLTSANVLAGDISRRKKRNIAIVSPDVGGVVRARAIAKRLNCPIVITEKRRSAANQSEVMNVIGEVRGKTLFIVDDIIDTAGTICNAADALLKEGAVEVYAYCTHGVFSGPAVERLSKSQIREVVCTDTVPLNEKARKLRKIRQVSVADLIATAMKRTIENKSVSDLFRYKAPAATTEGKPVK